MNVYVILGNSGAGKSAATRALSGRYHRGVKQLNIRNSPHDFFIQIRSLQEIGMTAQDFIQQMSLYAIDNILLNLRIKQIRKRSGVICPDGLSYINDFISSNWNIRGITVLNVNAVPTQLSQVTSNQIAIPNNLNLTESVIASRIRTAWNW